MTRIPLSFRADSRRRGSRCPRIAPSASPTATWLEYRQLRLLHPPQNASKRLHESSIDVGEVWRDFHHVLAKDASRNQRILRVCPVVEKKVLAQIGPVLEAEEAAVTGSRVGGNNTHAGPEAVTNS